MSDMMPRLGPASAHLPDPSVHAGLAEFERLVPKIGTPPVLRAPSVDEELAGEEEGADTEVPESAGVGESALLDGVTHDVTPLLSPGEANRPLANDPGSSAFKQLDATAQNVMEGIGNRRGAGHVPSFSASVQKALDQHGNPQSASVASPVAPDEPGLDASGLHRASASAERTALLPRRGSSAAHQATVSSIEAVGDVSLDGSMRDVARSVAVSGSERSALPAGSEGRPDTGISVDARQSLPGQSFVASPSETSKSIQVGEMPQTVTPHKALVAAPLRGLGGLAERPSDLPLSSDVVSREGAGDTPAQSSWKAASHGRLPYVSEEVVRDGRVVDEAARTLPRVPADTGDGPISEGLARFLLPPALPLGAAEEIAPQQLRLPQGAIAPAPHLQLADGIIAARDGAVEITLNPHELGRVKVMIMSDQTDLHIGMIVERADTLDLLRRHADLLLRELRDSGIDHAQLEFSRQEGDRNSDSDSAGGQGSAEDDGSVPQRGAGTRAQETASESAHRTDEMAARIRAGRRLDVRM